MAKRRSMNRRWSRRSTNISAFLNDNTSIFEDDDGYWRYLNQTNSRPPSDVDSTAATTVLDPNSFLMESISSNTQWKYLEKSTDNVPHRILRNPSRSSHSSLIESFAMKRSLEDQSASDSEVSVEIRKKRPLLRPRRKTKLESAFSINSSDSLIDLNAPPSSDKDKKTKISPGKSSQIQIRQAYPQDSNTSLEFQEVEKRRPLLRSQTSEQLDHGMSTSNNSMILASQEYRKSIVRPRSTLLSRSAGRIETKTIVATGNDSQKGSSSDTDSDELISQPRKIFGRVRFKVSENPFIGILDDTENGDQTDIHSPKKNSRSQSKKNDSDDFVLHISSVDTEQKSKELTKVHNVEPAPTDDTQLSESSISEDLKVSRPKLSGDNDGMLSQCSSEPFERIKPSRGDIGAGTEDTLPKENVIEIQRQNDSGPSEILKEFFTEPALSVSRLSSLSKRPGDSEEEVIVSNGTNRSTRRLKSMHLEVPASPIISGSVSQDIENHERIPDHIIIDDRHTRDETFSGKSLRLTRSSRKVVSSDSDELDIIGRIQNKAIGSSILRDSRLNGQSAQGQIQSDTELDVERVTDSESVSALNKSDGSSSEIPFLRTDSNADNRELLTEPIKNMTNVIIRPGPKSSKTPIKSSESPAHNFRQIPSSPRAKVTEMIVEKNHDTLVHPASSGATFFLKSILNEQQQLQKSANAEILEEAELQKRPGPKSSKKLQRSLQSTSKRLNIGKKSVEHLAASHKPQPIDTETESLSEIFLDKATRRSHPSLYALPDKERSPSISMSESDRETAESSLPMNLTRQTNQVSLSMFDTQTPRITKGTYTGRKNQSKNEHQQTLIKKVLSTILPPRNLSSSPSFVAPARNDDHTMPISNSSEMESTPAKSRKVVKKMKRFSTRDLKENQKFTQSKIDTFMHNKNEVSQKLQNSSVLFNSEEFKRKIKESKKILDVIRAREEKPEDQQTVKKEKEEINMVTRWKVQGIGKKPTKTVDRAFIINGKVYKRPTLPRPKHWATNKLYKFLWKKMESKFGEHVRVKSEKFVVELNEVMIVIMRRKKYDNYKEELTSLLRKMAQLGIIETRLDFHRFCFDFLPFEFRIKVVPMLRAGNTHNIPFEPEKLIEPVLA
ncbi:uncharacterized protein [Fopius arisanus]|nr:PREDICTED: uncharacterized protein LOC105270994 [Fopius arisanus]